MILFRRYWVAMLVIFMVFAHAVIIGYVRSEVARLQDLKTSSVEIGTLRFQTVADPSRLYSFTWHAQLEPLQRSRGEDRIRQLRTEILEEAELLVRQTDASWLADVEQVALREQLTEVLARQLNESLVQKVLITDWLVLPVAPVGPPGVETLTGK